MPKDPEQVLTSIDDREMLDKNGIRSTNHTLATPACYNKSINGDMIMNDVCLSTGDHDIKATSSTMSSSVLLSANNLNLVNHINSHDHGSNILLCHEYDDNDDDDAEEEEEGRSTLIHPDSSVKGIQEQDDQYPRVKMKDNMINSGNGRGFGGDGDGDEAKIRAELELEIERDLEREIKAKIMMLSQRLDDLNTSRRSRSLLSCSTTTALKPNIATITASKANNAHKNGNPRANHTAASTANDKRFDWTRTLRSSSDNKSFSMSSSYNQYSNNNIFINNVRSCSTPKLRAKYRSPSKSLEEAIIGYNKIANHNSADKIVSNNNTRCGSSSHVEAMIKQCHEDESDDSDQRCGSSNHVVAMVKQCHEDNEDFNHKINTSNVANSSRLLIKGNANHHHNHQAMPPRPPLPKDPPKQRIPCRKVVTTPKPGLLWR